MEEIRHLLKSSSTTDEELIAAVTKASALEKQRSTFQSRNKKQVKVFEVSSGSRSGSMSEESTVTKLVSAVDKLTLKVSSLQSELNDLKESSQTITDSNSFVPGSSRFKKLQNVNVTKIVLSIVITVFTVVLESSYYEIVPQPNIRSREIR